MVYPNPARVDEYTNDYDACIEDPFAQVGLSPEACELRFAK